MIYVCYLKFETFLESPDCCAYWSLTHGVTCYTACLDCVTILGCKRSHWEHLGSSSREALLKPRCLRQAMKFIFQRWNISCMHNSGELCLEVYWFLSAHSFYVLWLYKDFCKYALWSPVGPFDYLLIRNHYGKQDLVLYGTIW